MCVCVCVCVAGNGVGGGGTRGGGVAVGPCRMRKCPRQTVGEEQVDSQGDCQG